MKKKSINFCPNLKKKIVEKQKERKIEKGKKNLFHFLTLYELKKMKRWINE